MNRNKIRIIWLACCVVLLAAFLSMAGTEGGSGTVTNGQSEIWAGVVVDYMGKLRFVVRDETTENPIPGASIEIYLPYIKGADGKDGAYVLFGVTDENGILEIDVACNGMSQESDIETSEGKLTFTGSLLYLTDNHIQYRGYKADWEPYPREGEVELKSEEIPQVVPIWLRRRTGGGNGDGGGGGKTQVLPNRPEVPKADFPLLDLPDPDTPNAQIPKTGVDSYAAFWLGGFLLLSVSAVLLLIWIKKDEILERRE